ncbi:MAG: FadR/GntR family transcriptional regulator [Alphaproteobacteria bacterium]
MTRVTGAGREPPPNASSRPRARRKRPKIIAERIKDWIVERGLSPGDRLPGERELIDLFQASKGTIREALRVLETQGLIYTRTGPGGGVFVEALAEAQAIELLGNYFFFKSPTIADIYAIRILLEPQLVASIVGHLTEADFARLESTIRIYAHPPKDLEEERAQRHAELAFHDILADLCHNPILAFMCKFLHSLLRDLTVCRRIYERPNPDLRESGLSYQVTLIQALRRHDSSAAQRVMFEHMCAAQRLMEAQEAHVRASFLRLSDRLPSTSKVRTVTAKGATAMASPHGRLPPAAGS